MTAVAMMEAVFVLFADLVLGLTPFGIGLMFSAMGVIGAISQSTAAGRRRGGLGSGACCSPPYW